VLDVCPINVADLQVRTAFEWTEQHDDGSWQEYRVYAKGELSTSEDEQEAEEQQSNDGEGMHTRKDGSAERNKGQNEDNQQEMQVQEDLWEQEDSEDSIGSDSDGDSNEEERSGQGLLQRAAQVGEELLEAGTGTSTPPTIGLERVHVPVGRGGEPIQSGVLRMVQTMLLYEIESLQRGVLGAIPEGMAVGYSRLEKAADSMEDAADLAKLEATVRAMAMEMATVLEGTRPEEGLRALHGAWVRAGEDSSISPQDAWQDVGMEVEQLEKEELEVLLHAITRRLTEMADGCADTARGRYFYLWMGWGEQLKVAAMAKVLRNIGNGQYEWISEASDY